MSTSFSRRDALKLGSLSLAAVALMRGAPDSAPEAGASKKSPLNLGLASFSVSKMTNPEIIKVMTDLRLSRVSLYHSHAPWSEGTPAQCKAVVDLYAASGITVTGTGVIEFKNDEAFARKVFDNIKGAGVGKICARPEKDSLPLLDKLVREYDLRIAIHNHGPTDLYPTSADAWAAVQAFDPRIGICIDVGHAWRAGGDPAGEIRLIRDRLYEVHLKDTRGPKGTATRDPDPVVVGAGLMDIRSIVAALLEIGYQRETEFEYEVRSDNKIPGLCESVGYVRGLEAGLQA